MALDRGPGPFSPAYRAVAMSLLAGVALVSYNNLAATAALPDIGDDLGAVALLPWVITVELLAAAIAVLAVGPFIDGAGPRRAFRVTIVGFAMASFLCAVAPSMELLVLARIFQGLGTGALIGTAITSVGLVFKDRMRPRMYAMVSSIWGVMSIGGPTIAAGLVSTLGWRAVFAVNLPVAVIAGAIGWNRLPEQGATTPSRLDRRGLLLVSAVTVVLLGAASRVQWWSLVLLLVGAGLVAGYARHARSHPAPIVRILHVTGVRWRSLHLTAGLVVAGGTGAAVFLPLYMRGAREASTAAAAFSVVWLSLGWVSSAWAASRLHDRLRSQTIILSGTVVLAAATTSLVLVAAIRAPVPVLLGGFYLVGCGIGSATMSSLTLLQHRADDHEMGRVSSAHQFIRSLGFAYGAAVAGLALFTGVSRRIDDVEAVRDLLGGEEGVLGVTTADALASAYVWALAASAAFAVLALPAAVVLARTSDRSAHGYNADPSTRD